MSLVWFGSCDHACARPNTQPHHSPADMLARVHFLIVKSETREREREARYTKIKQKTRFLPLWMCVWSTVSVDSSPCISPISAMWKWVPIPQMESPFVWRSSSCCLHLFLFSSDLTNCRYKWTYTGRNGFTKRNGPALVEWADLVSPTEMAQHW
jgi:hypothetical protein